MKLNQPPLPLKYNFSPADIAKLSKVNLVIKKARLHHVSIYIQELEWNVVALCRGREGAAISLRTDFPLSWETEREVTRAARPTLLARILHFPLQPSSLTFSVFFPPNAFTPDGTESVGRGRDLVCPFTYNFLRPFWFKFGDFFLYCTHPKSETRSNKYKRIT